MGKNIVVITGSPRRNGNSFAMTDAFIRAAQEKGHTVTRFDAAFRKVGGCRACETCYRTGKACSFDDDFNEIAPAILAADALVFTMPVYWYSIPAQIKGVIDRIYSMVVGGKDISGKECALIACCEEDDLAVLDGVPHPHGAHRCAEQVEDGRRGAGPRRAEPRGRGQDRRLQARGRAGGTRSGANQERRGERESSLSRASIFAAVKIGSGEGPRRRRGSRRTSSPAPGSGSSAGRERHGR